MLHSYCFGLAFVAILAVGDCALAQATQPGFRVRSDFAAKLNSDKGWAGALNENVTIYADRPFRVRFEVEQEPGTDAQRFRLQVRRNDEKWTDVEAHRFPHPEGKTPQVSIVACSQAYKNGEASANLLAGSSARFRAGTGVSGSDHTKPWKGAGSHGEFEWALVVRRFADKAVTNEKDDAFEFRMIRADGAVLDGHMNPVLKFAIPSGHVGGTFVETPGRIGPWQASNGDLYFIMEPAETSNLFMMIKSTDNGATWREVDGKNRPSTHDLEGVDSRLVGDTIHILHQITHSSWYHSFRTSDHPTKPDSWAIRDELAGSAKAVAQAAAFVVRSDNSMVAFYVGKTKIHYSVRTPAGAWGKEAIIDADVAPNLAGPQAVLGTNDTVHLAYYGTDGTIWYRRLSSNGTLTDRQQIASGLGTSRKEFGAVLPLLYIPDANTVVILYQQASGKLCERRIVNDGPPTTEVKVTNRKVVQQAVDSQQPGADAVLDGKTVHVLFIEKESRSIFSTHDKGGWQPSTLQVNEIQGSWIRGNVYTREDGVRSYGYIYDAGSGGGSGMNRFGEVELSGR